MIEFTSADGNTQGCAGYLGIGPLTGMKFLIGVIPYLNYDLPIRVLARLQIAFDELEVGCRIVIHQRENTLALMDNSKANIPARHSIFTAHTQSFLG